MAQTIRVLKAGTLLGAIIVLALYPKELASKLEISRAPKDDNQRSQKKLHGPSSFS